MSEVTHTPGPWYVHNGIMQHPDGGEVGGFDIINREGYEVDVTVIGAIHAIGKRNIPDKETAHANAKLIAAAPDMIDELKDNHEFLLQLYSALGNRNGLDYNLIQQDLRDRMAKQLAIIDKATK